MESSYVNYQVSDHKDRHEYDDEEKQHCSYAMQLASSSVMPMVLQAAVELGVLEIIAKAGTGAQLSASQIASHMPTLNNPLAPAMLDRMLRLLAAHSVLTCSSIVVVSAAAHESQPPPQSQSQTSSSESQRLITYGLAPVAKYFVCNQDSVSLGHLMSLLQDKVFMDSWYELKASVVEGGIPFNRVHGTHAFDYPGKDPRFNEVFNKAMINYTTIVINKILQSSSYKVGFEHLHLNHKQLVDVGGGLGITLNIITSKFPHIKGINFDLPHVIQHAPPYPGVEHVGGDMFESVPKGDAIFMKWILNDWSDDQCLKLLKNCHKALPDNVKVIVVEGILPVIPDTSAAAKGICQIDLVMMTQNPGGKERTQHKFLAIATGAGLLALDSNVLPVTSGSWNFTSS